MDNLALIDQYLRELEFNFEHLEEHPVIRMGFSGENGTWNVFVTATSDGVVSVDSILDMYVPVALRPEVGELFTRINYGLRMGAFRMDLDDGEVRYRISIDVEGGHLTAKMWENLFFGNLSTMDAYFKAIMAVTYAGVSAAAAYATAQQERDD